MKYLVTGGCGFVGSNLAAEVLRRGEEFFTFEQRWIGCFCQQALEIMANPNREPFAISGTGKQVRDALYNIDIDNLYITAKHVPAAYGQVLALGGGIANSLSLLELFAMLEKKLGIKITYKQFPWCVSNQKVLIAGVEKVKRIGWEPNVIAEDGIGRMLD